jgi:outer membrane protein TolC
MICLACNLPAKGQEFSLGVITDYPQSSDLDSVMRLMVSQIDQTVGSAKKITLSPINVSYSNTNLTDAAKNYITLAKQVDLVLLIGSNTLKGVLGQGKFLVPTFGLGVTDPAIEDIPYVDGTSGIANFTYIWSSNGLEVDLTEFKKIAPYTHLSIITSTGTAQSLQSAASQVHLKNLEQKLNTQIKILAVGADMLLDLEKLDTLTDAVYISEIGVRSTLEVKALANQLMEKGIPSFTTAKWHVYQGMLACLADANSFTQVSRKLGIMVDEALAGKPLNTMPVKTLHAGQLFINELTASAIHLELPFEVLFTAKSVKANTQLRNYTVLEIIELALKNNLNIAITNQDILLANQDVKVARNTVLPNLDAFVNGRQINIQSTNATFDQPEKRLFGQLQLDQVIFSQEAFGSIKIAKYYANAQEYLTEAQILEEILNTLNDYLNLLAAKAVLQIEEENLENFELNLNIARLQVESGALSRTELFRWQSEVALASQAVVEASTNVIELKTILNNRLAFVLEKNYEVEDITVDDALYMQFRTGLIGRYIESPGDIKIMTDFLVEEAINSNPNKSFLEQQIYAVDRRRKQDKLLFYSPDIAFQAGTTQVFARGGQGSVPPEGRNFIDNTWSIGIGLRYPLFQQLTRKTNLGTSTILLDQLHNSEVQLDQSLELAIRTSVLNAIAATANIDYSKVASTNAHSNFKLMQVRYGEGDIDITQLIDAQRNAMQAKLRYMVSIYDYIRSQLNIHYAIGFFPLLAPESTSTEFTARFLQFKSNIDEE